MILDRDGDADRRRAVAHLANRRHAALPFAMDVLALDLVRGEDANDSGTELRSNAPADDSTYATWNSTRGTSAPGG